MNLKYLIITLILSAGIYKINGQISSGKKTFKFNNAPELSIENISFLDDNKDQKADAGEKCYLVFNILNTGKSTAKAVSVFTDGPDSLHTYFSFDESFTVGDIKPDETRQVKIPMVAAGSFKSSRVSFKIIAREANNYNSDPALYSITVKATGASTAFAWTFPDNPETYVSLGSITIKACISTNLPVSEVVIYKNNKIFQVDRGFKIKKGQDCDNYIEQEINLDEGNNLIQIKAKINKTKVESEIRNVVYKKVEYEKRYALVIGNGDYLTAPLRNPVNDADLITKQLTKLNFNVKTLKNATQNQMKLAISEFGSLLAQDKKSVGLFYYAGHGVQVKGKNFLIPVDAKIEKEPDVEVYCVDLDGLLGNLEYSGNNMNIIILDACRNNPFGRSFRSQAGNGLATVNAPVGTFIAYATSPGSVAADGSGSNGLYTEEFVKAISIPNIKIEDVFKKVRTQVKTISEGKQIPWENSSIEGDFYFIK
ncbi:MAG: caspase family protein [Bacteroidales bacterium]